MDAVSVGSDGAIYLSTTGNFSVTGVDGADEDVFVFDPTSLGTGTAGNYRSNRFFDGSTFGFGNDMGGLHVVDSAGVAAGSAATGSAAADALMVIADVGYFAAEPMGPLPMGPLPTMAQWQFLAGGESDHETAEQTGLVPAADEESSTDARLFCLDHVFANWGTECCSELEFDQNLSAQVYGTLPEQLRIFVDANAR